MTDNKTTRGVKKEHDQMRKKISYRKDSKYLKCGGAIGGIYTELMRQ